jgi:hypothetical protein
MLIGVRDAFHAQEWVQSAVSPSPVVSALSDSKTWKISRPLTWGEKTERRLPKWLSGVISDHFMTKGLMRAGFWFSDTVVGDIAGLPVVPMDEY